MRVTTGRVVNGKIEVPDEELAEGMIVTILAPEDRGTFTFGPEAEAALLASIEEADRGEVITTEELLRELRRDQRQASWRAAHSLEQGSALPLLPR